MAATSSSESTDGPVLSFVNKRLRALRKKYNRIVQMEEAVAQGKPINNEQEDVLRSKPSVCAAIDELEKLRQPLSVAVSEEVALAIQRQQHQSSISSNAVDAKDGSQEPIGESGEGKGGESGFAVEDLLNLLYFGSLFDVKGQNDFAAIMYTRIHERGCCLSYDVVTDDATDMLGERDLDLISMLGGLLISRPVYSSLTHKDALQRCVEHAKSWLAKSDQPIEPNGSVSYAELRNRLDKIMGSHYFIQKPEMKAVPVQVDCSAEQYQENEETANFQGHKTGESQSSPAEEFEKGEVEPEIPIEEASGEQGQAKPTELEHTQREVDQKEQHHPRRNYQNQRGGHGGGGGRRGYSNGRGGRNGGRGGGYQNGRGQYYERSGNNFYQRNYYNNRGRGGRGGGHPYNNHPHGSGVQGGHGPADVGVAS